MKQKDIRIALLNAEASLNIEGLSVSNQTKALCEKLLADEITMNEYITIITENSMVSANGV